MENYQAVFERTEQKYFLSAIALQKLLPLLSEHMTEDRHGNSTIMSLYFDNEGDDLIRRSLEKPVYKEKMRLRSYGVPSEKSTVFLEIKKKYDGIVYKRRIALTLREARLFIVCGALPEKSQIARELQYFRHFYRCYPKAMIAYDRIAMYDKRNPSLRITIDRNIRGRGEDLDLSEGAGGNALMAPGDAILEVKAQGGIPLWLCRLLYECKAEPTSFSKYGAFYRQQVLTNLSAGGIDHVQQCS